MAATAALLLAAYGAQAAPADDMRQRLDAGDARAAYETGLASGADEAGDLQFDFYFGLAAVESGHPDQAVFALERVLMQQPDNPRARLELARAQFLLGDDRAAQRNFQAVLDADPPPKVREHIQLFLGRIDRRLHQTQSHLSANVGLTVGSDSNINSATSDTTVDVPALGQITLDDTSRSIRDRFRTVDAAAEWHYLLSKVSGLFASAALKDQNNFSSDIFDTTVVGLRAGYTHQWGADRLDLPLQYQALWVDGDAFRRMTTVGAEWSRLHETDQPSLYAQFGTLRYPDQRARDADLILAGGGWSHDFGHRVTGLGGLYYGHEEATEAVGKHNGRSYYGMRLGGQWSFAATQALYVVAAAQKVRHAAVDPVFALTREDNFEQASLGWSWQAAAHLAVNVSAEYYANQSNIGLYAYHRSVVQAALQYGFD